MKKGEKKKNWNKKGILKMRYHKHVMWEEIDQADNSYAQNISEGHFKV